MPNDREIILDFPLYRNDEYTIKIIAKHEEISENKKYLQHDIVIMKHDSFTIAYIWFRTDQMRDMIKQLQCYVELVDSMVFGET